MISGSCERGTARSLKLSSTASEYISEGKSEGSGQAVFQFDPELLRLSAHLQTRAGLITCSDASGRANSHAAGDIGDEEGESGPDSIAVGRSQCFQRR